MKTKYMSIFSDFFYNILSSLISTGVIQLILYPKLALSLTSEEYGSFLTIISIVNVITLSLGNNLATTRLIKNEEYRRKNLHGDFNILLLFSIIMNYIILYVYNIQFHLDFMLFHCVALASSLIIIRSYLSVIFRLKINYKKYLLLNIILAIGFLLGALFFSDYEYWPVIYIVSNSLGIIFVLQSNNLLKEPLKCTNNFSRTFKSYLFLASSGFIGNLTTYLDRIIIYPVLGATSVSIFSVASFLGKSFALIVTPITSVMLSYICHEKFIMTKKIYVRLNILFISIAFIVFIGCLLFENPITFLLYPTVYEMAKPYILIANISSILGILSSFNGTVILKYAPHYWQVIITSIKIIVYIILGVIMMNMYALFGFAIALIVTNLFNVSLNFIVGYYYINRRRGIKIV